MKNLIVVHVDDDEDIRTIVQISFSLEPGIELIQFESGNDAIAAAETLAPDLIVLDYMMPGLNGLETLQELRMVQSCSDTPVVFMTAKAEEDMRGQLISAGAVGVITKPFDPVTLARKVSQFATTASTGSEQFEKQRTMGNQIHQST